MKLLLVLCFCLSSVRIVDPQASSKVFNNTIKSGPAAKKAVVDTNAEIWRKYKLKHNKTYSPQEDQIRFKTFLLKTKKIEEHNEKYKNGTTSYSKEENYFTDMKVSEIREMVHGFVKPNGTASVLTLPVGGTPVSALDWRSMGAVTPVKNQGRCSSCWAFAAIACMEGTNYLNTGNLERFSEQELMDCSSNYGNKGCNSGSMTQAYRYVIDKNGINNDSTYPYEAKVGLCRSNDDYRDCGIQSYRCIRPNENALKVAVATYGPTGVGVDIGLESFYGYARGVYDDPACTGQRPDHAMTVVGYGTLDGKDYWLVKNSWGTDWGDDGYVMMSRNNGNQCGIANFACYPSF